MKIAIDARALSHPQPGGFKTYTANLIRALLALESDDSYILYLDRPLENPAEFASTNARLEVVAPFAGWAGAAVREQVTLARHLRHDKPDIVHFPCNTGTLATRVPTVVTMHDAIEFLERPRQGGGHRENLRRHLMAGYNRTVQRAIAHRAACVLTDSENSRKDLATVLGKLAARIHHIPIAQSLLFGPCTDPVQLHEFRVRFNLPPTFVLALVAASPRKNAEGLLRIFAQLSPALRSQFPLVLVWTHDHLKSMVETWIQRLDLSESVHFAKCVADQDLRMMYNAATVFVYPSLYEGFGLPVLEAMACGTPVVATNLTSVPEVAGQAAALADPRDETDFAAVLSAVLTSGDRREGLRTAGLARAREFSWERTARMTREAYSQVLSR